MSIGSEQADKYFLKYEYIQVVQFFENRMEMTFGERQNDDVDDDRSKDWSTYF